MSIDIIAELVLTRMENVCHILFAGRCKMASGCVTAVGVLSANSPPYNRKKILVLLIYSSIIYPKMQQ